MRLSQQTDYALRMLTYLAVNDGTRSTIADIAEIFDVSRNHLMKVANRLVQEGFVASVRGRRGGLELTRPAAEICLGDVVRAIEPDFAVAECFRADGACLIAGPCRLPKVLEEAVNAFLGVLDQCTLDQLTMRNRPMAQLLAAE